MVWHKKIMRRMSLALLAGSSQESLLQLGEKRVLRAFRRAAANIPAYKATLASHGVKPDDIRSIKAFQTLCPTLNKGNTFAQYPLNELCHAAALANLAGVLTSSGHGARFGYGLTTRLQAKYACDAIDLGLEYAFQVDSNKTLLINCLPMGVRFSANSVTVAETSVREDMAVALATEFGRFYDQIIFVGDPLFLKLVTDYAREKNVDWSQHKVHLIIGEETFGEHFRNYLAGHFHLDNDDPSTGMIGSSMGVAELGLNLFYETPQTIRLRRLAHANPLFFEALFGVPPARTPLPMLFVYNPLRTYVETVGVDATGYGDLTISMSDPETALPLLRYQTGDIARILSPQEINRACELAGVPSPGKMALPIIALPGRSKDRLPDATHVGQYKDALYVHQDIAAKLTGAFRLEYLHSENSRIENSEAKILIHIQLRQGFDADDDLRSRLAMEFPGNNVSPDQVKTWSYLQFPYGMTLDYERKFNYYA
jgi:phenylacetate-CoA ligase